MICFCPTCYNEKPTLQPTEVAQTPTQSIVTAVAANSLQAPDVPKEEILTPLARRRIEALGLLRTWDPHVQFKFSSAILQYSQYQYVRNIPESLSYSRLTASFFPPSTGIAGIIYDYQTEYNPIKLYEWCVIHLNLNENEQEEFKYILERCCSGDSKEARGNLQLIGKIHTILVNCIYVFHCKQVNNTITFGERMEFERNFIRSIREMWFPINKENYALDNDYAFRSLLRVVLEDIVGKAEIILQNLDGTNAVSRLQREVSLDVIRARKHEIPPQSVLRRIVKLSAVFSSESSFKHRNPLFDWAFKHYDLDQFEIVDGKKVFDVLTLALAADQAQLKESGSLLLADLTQNGILFLLESAGIIERVEEE